MTLDKYIATLSTSLQHAGAHQFYFPPDAEQRKQQNLRLGRELGYGLVGYSLQDVDKILNTLYGSIIVKNSLDRTGVVIDNKQWLAAIQEGMQITGG